MQGEVELSARELGVMTRATRFAASQLVNELSPAAGQVIGDITQLSSVAALTGGTFAAIAGTAGVGALVIVLGMLVKSALEADKALRTMMAAIDTGDLKKMEEGLDGLDKRIRDVEAELLIGTSLFQKFLRSGAGAVEGFGGFDIVPIEEQLRDDLAALKKLRDELREGIIGQKNIDEARKLAEEQTKLWTEVGEARRKAAETAENEFWITLMKQGEEVTKSVLTAQQKYDAELKSYRDLLNVGAITQETFNRAVKASAEKLKEATEAADTYGKMWKEVDEKQRLAMEGLENTEWINRLNEAKRTIEAIRTPQEKYNERIAELVDLYSMGALTADQFHRAVTLAGDEATRSMEALRSKTGATEDAARALGLTFQSAFEDAIIQGDSLSDVLRGLLQDIERIILRLTVTQPLAKGITSLIGGGLSGLFGAGAGGGGVNSFIAGIESTGVFVPLQHGGIITRPTMTVMGEAGPEAVIPLDRLSEFGGGGEITINVDARGAQRGVGPEVERAIISAMNQMRSEVVPIVDEAVKRGGPFRTTFRR